MSGEYRAINLVKGCVRSIFASLFLSLKESSCETKKNVFYLSSFHSRENQDIQDILDVQV